jgi:alpha-tubulin suppressor-like RCC1 family protein
MRPSARIYAQAALALTTLLPLGCGLVLGLEDPKDRTTQTSSNTGGGGASSSNSSSGGGGTGGVTSSSSSGSTGGGGHGGGTCDPTACEATSTTCATASCDGDQCVLAPTAVGTPCTENGGKACDGNGACITCTKAADCTPPNGCQTAVCNPDGTCGTKPLPDGPAAPGACGQGCTHGCDVDGTCSAGECVCDPPDVVSLPFDCGNGCVDLADDATNCGFCGYACPTGNTCQVGTCTAPQPTLTPTVNLVAAPAFGTKNTTALTLTSAAGFGPGQEILVHQTQGPTAGLWEEAKIASVNGNTLTLAAPLANTYVVDAATNQHAQAVVIETFSMLDVPAGMVLTAPAWDGNTGGILAVHVTGTMTVEGTISMSGRGFRGAEHPCATNMLHTCQDGQAGESPLGPGAPGIKNNGPGGGGGSRGQDCGMAAGGSYGTTGEPGPNHTTNGGICVAMPKAGNSLPGTTIGTADLLQTMLFGGAGGEGGGDDDGAYPGKGGNGGGIVFIRASSLVVSGTIASDGEAGGNGHQFACGGSGAGIAGGGGGAGGAVRISVPVVDTSAGTISVAGGAGGLCDYPNQTIAGAGGMGRVDIQLPTCTDGAKNGMETDVDCGGTCSTQCGLHQGCKVDGDCATGHCISGVCDHPITGLGGGGAHTCALRASGVLKCWGRNTSGQLGLGDTMGRGNGPGQMGQSLPAVNLGTGRTAKAIGAGDDFNCAILDDGTVKCWGGNASGQLGQGDTTARGGAPSDMGDNLATVQLGTGRTAKVIAAGHSHACAILDDGSLKCWGDNGAGELGLGDTQSRGTMAGQMGDALPAVSLGTGRTAVALALGLSYTCALLDDATVKCWGQGFNAGTTPSSMGNNLPALSLGTGRTVKSIVAGVLHTCVLLDDATVKCFGYNSDGRLGYGDTAGHTGMDGNALPAINLGTGHTALAITAHANGACALLDDHGLKCWGWNNHGQLGLGDTTLRGALPADMGDNLQSVKLGTNRTTLSVAGGAFTMCAVLDDLTLKCWGWGGYGQLGSGSSGDLGTQSGQMGDALPVVQF